MRRVRCRWEMAPDGDLGALALQEFVITPLSDLQERAELVFYVLTGVSACLPYGSNRDVYPLSVPPSARLLVPSVRSRTRPAFAYGLNRCPT